ncbi:MAG: ribonuclease HII [Armatimonadetes bacterium]|nr:ribonuclease HII [Armatimonadota bacterium]MDW8122831.1 ribonuclease HII [Armatimonadota bacterium]
MVESTVQRFLIGVDEAGRGALAGPVVAAAVLIAEPECALHHPLVRDSKTLSPREREEAFDYLLSRLIFFAIGSASPKEIDRLNIRRATLLAMRRALQRLFKKIPLSPSRPVLVLVDGDPLGALPLPCRFVIKGDRTHPVISAASIIAKVSRDRLMERMEGKFPGYGLATHKGYATAQHIQALLQKGPSPIHRLSFQPVRQVLANGTNDGNRLFIVAEV